jgi:flagellar hook-associated protein 3 FlgL
MNIRVTQASEQAQFLASIDALEAGISQTQNQLSSGLAFTSPAQDPAAAGEVANYNQVLSQSLQYTANGSSVQTGLTTEDTALTQVQTQLRSLRGLALEANSGTASSQDLSAIATQALAIQNSLIGIANTQDGNGNYIFAGFAGQTQPFAATAGGATYAGDQGQMQVQIAAGQNVAAGDSGIAVFGDNTTGHLKTGNGTFAVTAGTAAAPNAGSGLLGAATLTSPTKYAGGTFTISFTGATDYYITDSTNPASPTPYTNYTPGGTITYGGVQVPLTGQPNGLVEAAASNTGSGVGAATLTGPPPYAGGKYTITFTKATPTSSTTYAITDTAGAPLPGPGSTGTYVPGVPITYGGVQVKMTGQPASGDTFAVAPGDTFTVAPSSDQSVFKTVQDLITAIQTPGTGAGASTQLSNAIAASISNIDQALNNASNVQSSVGGRLNEITTQQSVASSQQLQLQKSIASLQGLDVPAALTTLESLNTTLSAAMQAFTLTQGLTLFKYIS